MRAYQSILPQLKERGATLVAISPQTPDNSLTIAEKNALEFAVLSDLDNQVARQYGLVMTVGEAIRTVYQGLKIDLPTYNGTASFELPIPGTFVIASDGLIRFAYVDPDYTKRLEPDKILTVLNSL